MIINNTVSVSREFIQRISIRKNTDNDELHVRLNIKMQAALAAI